MAQRFPLFRVKLARRIWMWLMTGSMHRYQVYLPSYPMMLEQNQLETCRVVCHRKELLAQLSLRANPNVAEIGVLRGDFSLVLMEQLRPAKLHLFDLDFKTHRIAERFASEIAAGRVHLHEGDSSSNISAFPKEYFDVIYIDGDHSKEGVVKDIEASVPRLSAQGYLIFNDYTCWSPCENLQYGIMPAVNEFCRRENWEATHFALDGYMYCDLAIRKRISAPPGGRNLAE